ncbi:MAG: hypothetical protein KDK56_08380 [Simkania sp.]|nr:hypothetical protein [Simkania sp.]MCP5490965.1 hypothetical protein [Chlamydiales bacterium]
MKKTLTILELFFCVAILALVGSLVIFKAKPMIAQYRFQTSVHRLAKELEWSHKVAMSAEADIDFRIEKKKDTLYCTRVTDEPLGFRGGNKELKIEQITQLFFDGEEISELKLTFTRTGSIRPEGNIQLSSSNKTLQIPLNPAQNRVIAASET